MQSEIGTSAEARTRAMTRRAHLGWAASAAALIGPACAVPGGASETTSVKKPQGRVEFWSNSGYPYKDRIGSSLVAEFEQANPGLKVEWTDTPATTKLFEATVAGAPPDLGYADRF